MTLQGQARGKRWGKRWGKYRGKRWGTIHRTFSYNPLIEVFHRSRTYRRNKFRRLISLFEFMEIARRLCCRIARQMFTFPEPRSSEGTPTSGTRVE